ncbi:alpha/beta hydrolase [Aliiroseovarius sp. KMU-50]|uniref:Alpha/beta hydrolase n=1 Tax=Aliiroseovarius salicola TaxID=3009082 RepID=A0ABT4W239_9RHOB|nr:alpha/beta hydrolase [Aliiroseovarius sp. KMU-50]MDA5094565.1 alpha/beta hydrolase [Aliiroseovarius sp. KMU-50]
MLHMQKAPLFEDIAKGPERGQAYWLTASDGVRIRVGHWPATGTENKGSILLFPGRTEYVEKYGLIASELTVQGYDVLAIDWRGQGLADRSDPERDLGHVGTFSEYQMDVQAMLGQAELLELPRPWYLIGHSMGGCIGLRALQEGLPVDGAIFSAPMWGIVMSAAMRPVAWGLSWALHKSRFKMMLTPGTTRETYLSLAPFEDNLLTTDLEMFDYMRDQASVHPELTLGGPTTGWLYAALIETRALMALPPPPVKTVTFLGTQERIVMSEPIIAYMENWEQGHLVMVDGAEHEIMMEAAPIRQQVYDALAQLSEKQEEPA